MRNVKVAAIERLFDGEFYSLPLPVEYEGLRMGSLPEYFWEDPEIKIDVYRACPEHKTRLNDELECSKGHKCKRWIRLPRRLGEGLEWSAAEPKT